MAMTQNYNMTNNNKKNTKKIVGIVAGIVCICVAIVAFYIYSALQPLDRSSKEEMLVEIPRGSGANSIGRILEEQGVISSGSNFALYARVRNETGFLAGTYRLSPSMSLRTIVANLQDSSKKEPLHRVTIPEGKQIEEIAVIIEKELGIPQADFLAKVNDQEYLKELQKRFPTILTDKIFQDGLRYSLEGYLFPATYNFYQENVTIADVIEPMLQQTVDVLSQYKEEMEAKGLTVHELLTMASLIEEEATELGDRKKIASVFYNRLAINMPLQTDPTVLYALGVHKDRVLYKHLTVDSPFNTYRVRGLPIGPIANAGRESILAALEPDETDYLFFLANRYGQNFFSRTYEEHRKLREEHITRRWAEEE